MTDLIGKTLGRYQLVSRVGRGGMARVYKGYQQSLDRYVAIKVLHSHLAEDPDFVERFEREATAVARLRHPNIVQVYDYDVDDDLYYIVMEFVEGPTLKAELGERLKRQSDIRQYAFSLDEIARLFTALADAIDFAHSRGMIHRDIKPGNIMFTTDGQVMLTDFGLARMVFVSEQSETGALSGTPAYMAPEQVQGGRVDERSDIYSLGVVLYELFTGRAPFNAETPYAIMTMHVTHEVPPMRQYNPDLPINAETVVSKTLSKDPDLRYQSAASLANALQEAVGVFVVQTTAGSGQLSPIATLADSQEMMAVSTHAGLSAASFAAISSPYRGLYAFREEDAPFFFGREGFTRKVADTLTEQSMAAVIGPSGSGKSSVIFAGLLPTLREQANWTILEMRPGSQPFSSLAGSLIESLEPENGETSRLIETRQMATALKEGRLKLNDVLDRIAQKARSNGHVLIVVDQFEELYTLCTDEETRHRFPNILFAAVDESKNRQDTQFSLVLTLRADFMSQALTDRPFADALQDADVKLGPMTRAELGRAIESPAAKQRVVFEAGLVDRILDEVGEEPGNLPLLEFALTLLWERRSGRRLTHAAYETIGRVEGSLARYADEIYEQLDRDDQVRARRVFTQMVRPGEGTEDTRRLATRAELSEKDWTLVRQLADARLVVTGRSPEGEETVEVVHEALIRGWGRLRTWMNSERAFRSWQERMRVAMHQWEDSNWDEGALLRGAPLAEAEEWQEQKSSDIGDKERQYIEASILMREQLAEEQEAQRKRELANARKLAEEQRRRAEAEHNRAEEQTRSSRNLKILSVVLTIVFLLAVAAAIFAIGQSQDAAREADARATEVVIRGAAELNAMDSANLAATRAAESASARVTAEAERFRANDAADQALVAKGEAENERDRADEQAQLALARQLAAQSATLQGPQLDLALLLSLESNNVQNTAETISSILSALQANPNLITYLRGHPSLLQSVDFSPDGQFLATAGAEGLVLLWDVTTGNILQDFQGHDPTQLVNRVVFSPDGQVLATASDDLTVILWDVERGDQIHTLNGHTAWAQSVDFSSDGKRLVSGSGDRSAIVWDVGNGRPLQTLIGHSGPIWDAVFSNDGTMISSASADGSVIVWDATTGQPIQTINAHNGAAFNVDFDPTDKILVSGGGDNNLVMWDIGTGEQIGDPLTGHGAGVVDVTFSPDGQIIASTGADSTVRLWDSDSQQQLQIFGAHSGLVPSVSFNPDGTKIASGDATGTAILWDITPGIQPLSKVITGHVGAVNFVDIHPAGDVMVSTGADSTVRFWDIENRIQIGEPITHGLRITESVTALAFSANGELLVSGSNNGTVNFWDVSSGEASTATISAMANGITSLALSQDGTTVVAGGPTGFTSLWNVATGNQIGPFLSGHASRVNAVAISPDGQIFASGGANGSVIIRTLGEIIAAQAGTPISPLHYPQISNSSVLHLAFSTDNQYLLSADNNGQVVLWDVRDRAPIGQQTMGDFIAVQDIQFAPDGNTLAIAGANGEVWLWDSLLNEQVRPSLKSSADEIWKVVFSEDGQRLIQLSPDGAIIWDIDAGEVISDVRLTLGEDNGETSIGMTENTVAASSDDSRIHLFDLVSGEPFSQSLTHTAPFLGNVNAAKYSPDGKILATAGADGAIVLWDVATRKPLLGPLTGHYGAVVNLAFSPDGQLLASGSCSQFHTAGNCIGGEVILWNSISGLPVDVFSDTVGFSQALVFSPDGETLVTNDCTRVEVAGVCIEGTLRIWDVRTGQIKENAFDGHTGFVWSAAFSPDGRVLASASGDNTIILWDVESGRPIGQRLSNHVGPVRRVAFSKDGARLASAGFDNLVFFWDVESGQAIGGPVATYTNNAVDVIFSPDDEMLVSSSADGTITITDVDLESWKTSVCNTANRNMRPEEWRLFFGEEPYRETCPGR